MATAKSIIEIEVDDAEFERHKQAFDKYKKSVSELPGAWGKVDKSTKGTSAAFDEMVSKAIKQRVAAENIAKADKEAEKALRSSSSHYKQIATASKEVAKSTASAAKNIAGATMSLLRWSSIFGAFSGVLGAGGLFGISRMAQSAASTRFQSQGLGVSPGELKSAQINYSKVLGDPAGTMGAIRDAQYDLTKRWAFSAMGVNPSGKDAAQLLGPMIKAARSTFIQSGGTQQGAEAHGLTNFFSMEDLTRFKNMSETEIDAMVKRAEKDREALSLSDRTMRQWQEFDQQLSRSGQLIENAFIRGLLPLAKPLENLSAAVAGSVESFLKSKVAVELIEKAGKGIESFAKYMASEEFKSDMNGVLDSLDSLAGAFYITAQKLGKLFNWNETTLSGSQYRKINALHDVDPALASKVRDYLENPSKQGENQQSMWAAIRQAAAKNPKVDQLVKDLGVNAGTVATGGKSPALGVAGFSALESSYKLPSGTLDRLWLAESSRGKNMMSPAGAQGHFGFMGDTAKRFGLKDPYDLNQSSQAAAQYMSYLMKKFDNDLRKSVAAYNWGEGNMAKLVARYGSDWERHAPAETQREIAVVVQNNTGGNAVVTATQLPH